MSGDDSRIVKDPICGKDVDTLRARAVGIFGGVTYYFCSQACKGKFVDPRKEPRGSTVDSRPSTAPEQKPEQKKPEKLEKKADKKAELKKAEPKRAEPEKAEPTRADQHEPDAPEGGSDEPVRYARSRMRRVTGEVATPVVQIDLSPNKRPADRAAATGSADAIDEPLEPARSARGWAWIAIVMLILAGGVIFFTLKHR